VQESAVKKLIPASPVECPLPDQDDRIDLAEQKLLDETRIGHEAVNQENESCYDLLQPTEFGTNSGVNHGAGGDADKDGVSDLPRRPLGARAAA
jgi:hypothetical protein